MVSPSSKLKSEQKSKRQKSSATTTGLWRKNGAAAAQFRGRGTCIDGGGSTGRG